MKRLWPIAVTLLVASCLTEPTTAVKTGMEPARMERIEEFKTPVVVQETISFADGLVDRVISYQYEDGYSRLIATVAQKPSSSKVLERVLYAYADTRLLSKTAYGVDGLVASTLVYAYGEDGELTGETILDARNQAQSLSTWTWELGKKSSWRVFSGANAPLARTDYVYEGDTLKVARLYDGSGGNKGRIEYSYKDDGELIRIDYFNAAGTQDGRTEYTHGNGLVVEERVYRADGRLERRIHYGYSPDGALIKKTLTDSSGRTRETIVYEHAYRTDTRTIVY